MSLFLSSEFRNVLPAPVRAPSPYPTELETLRCYAAAETRFLHILERKRVPLVGEMEIPLGYPKLTPPGGFKPAHDHSWVPLFLFRSTLRASGASVAAGGHAELSARAHSVG